MVKGGQISVVLALMVSAICAFARAGELTDYVDLFTGTAGTGHTHPAAARPFGMVQAGPDTGCNNWAYCPGYQYRDTSVLGYSLTHLSGTGCPDYGDVQILPFAGAAVEAQFAPRKPLRRPIDKASEKASPGYYRVVQPEDGLEIEITAAKRAAIYRVTGGKEGEVKVLLNLTFGLGDYVYADDVSKMDVVTSDAKHEIAGKRMVFGDHWRTGWILQRRIGYAIEFNRDWKRIERLPGATGTPDEAPRYVATFAAGDEPLYIKAAFSTVDGAGAKANLAEAIPGWDFDGIRDAARKAWNAILSRATCEGTDEQKKNWYTALYHLYLQPNDWADVDGRYRGADNRVRTSADGTYFTTLSLWDTFRAAQPWYTIVTPEIVEPIIRSMLAHYRAYGRIPVMSYGGKNVDCMVGNHAIPVIVDAYLKGFRNFDAALAFEAITNTLTVAHPGKPKEDWDLWDKYGYFPCDIIRGESVSRGLECAYGDWCAAVFARDTGHDKTAAFFAKRSRNWKNTFDSSIGFGRGKTAKGEWRDPFDPYAFGHGTENDNDFTEGNAFQYSWHVMQDVPGLVAEMGGRDKFVERLDALFTTNPQGPDTKGDAILLDISGMIGQYVHGNEPSHHVIYFYPQVGCPDKAAERIREVIDTQYHTGPTGLCGNDDCGQMSAWYVFSAMGFYPFNPCGGEYVIGAPQVPKATLKLANGKTFTMTAKGLSKENKYVKSVTLNGKAITDWKIRHEDIVKGGELVFEMSGRSCGLGVCAHVSRDEFADRMKTYEMAKAVGMDMIRTDFDWSQCQPKEDEEFNFGRFDQIVDDATKAGVKILPLLGFPPQWAQPVTAHLAQWRRYVSETTRHFKGRVEAVEIWNEENLPCFWKNPNAADYLPVLKAAYEEVKKVDPGIRVLVGGFAGVPLDYIRKLYQLGAKSYFDIMNVHPYSWPNPPVGRVDLEIGDLRKLMGEFGDAAKPIWITEIGWPTFKPRFPAQNLFLAGLKAARPDRQTWRIGYVDVNDTEAKGGEYAAAMREILPSGSTAVAYTPKDLVAHLDGLDAVVYPFAESVAVDTIGPVSKFVKKGGVLVDFGGCPMWFTFKDGRCVEKAPDGRQYRSIAWEAFRIHVVWPDEVNGLADRGKTLATDAATREGLKFEPNGFSCFRFFDGKWLKDGDQFVPLTTTTGKDGKEYVGAALYKFNSDYKGAVVVAGCGGDKGGTSEHEQADYTVQMVDLAKRLNIERLFFYELRSPEKDPYYSEDNFGLLHKDFSPKPAYEALRTHCQH